LTPLSCIFPWFYPSMQHPSIFTCNKPTLKKAEKGLPPAASRINIDICATKP